MMWMGLVSAWGALVIGFVFVAFAGTNFTLTATPIAMLIAGVLLMIGGVRTLRKLSGGLRLLSGAWGLAAGIMVLPFAQSGSLAGFLRELGPFGYAIIAVAFICASGLALTVLHQERK